MSGFRIPGFALLALAAVLVFFIAGSDSGGSGGEEKFAELVSVAVARGDLNEVNAESAPQQQVVNGWVAADLLEISALAQAELVEASRQGTPADDRTAGLLLVGVLALVWHGVTLSSFERRVEPGASGPADVEAAAVGLSNDPAAPIEE